MHVLFRLRMSKTRKTATIYCRITMGGIRSASDFTTGIKCLPAHWDSKAQAIVEGNTDENAVLHRIREDLRLLCLQMSAHNGSCTADDVKEAYLKPKMRDLTFSEAGAMYIDAKRRQVGVKVKPVTIGTYENRYAYFMRFLADIGRPRLRMSQVDSRLMEKFCEWGTVTNRHGDSFVSKAVSQVTQTINFCIREGYLDNNRLAGFSHPRDQPTYPEKLSEQQIEKLWAHQYSDRMLQHVNDAALFQVYTGFDYADMVAFDPARHVMTDGASGHTFIHKTREKKPLRCHGMDMLVPVTPRLHALLERHGGRCPVVMPNGNAVSYDQYRRGLKMISEIHGFGLNLKSKTLRKTFAMLMTAKGVSLQAVSRMMGHNSIRTTEKIYAKIEAGRIAAEVVGVV